MPDNASSHKPSHRYPPELRERAVLEMTRFARGDALPGLVHHSDRGVQYLAIRDTERLAEAGVVNSVGSKGDSLLTTPSPRRSTASTRPS